MQGKTISENPRKYIRTKLRELREIQREQAKQKEIVNCIIKDVVRMEPKTEEDLHRAIDGVINNYFKTIRCLPETQETMNAIIRQVQEGAIAELKNRNPLLVVYPKEEIVCKVEKIFNSYLISTQESKRAFKLAIRVGLFTFSAYGFNSITTGFTNMKNIIDIIKEGLQGNPQSFEKLVVFTPVFILGALAWYITLLLLRSIKKYFRLSQEAYPQIEKMSKEYTRNENFSQMLKAILASQHSDEDKFKFLKMIRKYLLASTRKYKRQIAICHKVLTLRKKQKNTDTLYWRTILAQIMNLDDVNEKVSNQQIDAFLNERKADLVHVQDLYYNLFVEAYAPYKDRFSWDAQLIVLFERAWDWLLAKEKKSTK